MIAHSPENVSSQRADPAQPGRPIELPKGGIAADLIDVDEGPSRAERTGDSPEQAGTRPKAAAKSTAKGVINRVCWFGFESNLIATFPHGESSDAFDLPVGRPLADAAQHGFRLGHQCSRDGVNSPIEENG